MLEAKVHLFLRGLPKLMRCTGEGEHLLLNGATVCPHDDCDAQATFPLGVCLGCGQATTWNALSPTVRWCGIWPSGCTPIP